jgi:hypothetical protein
MKNTIGTLGVILCLLYSTFLFAQVPDTLWTRTYGGTSSDVGTSVQQTTDSGYIITGTTHSFGVGMDDVYLIKTDSNGDTLWTKTYGGTGDDKGSSVQQTADSGYIITGMTNSLGDSEYDVYLIKTDSNGDTLWTKTYGGTEHEYGLSVQQTTDDGYIIAGHTDSFGAGGDDVYLIKTDSNGDTLWTKTYGGGGHEKGKSVQQTIDSGYIITGYTGSFGFDADVYLIKTDSNGDTLWTKTYDGTVGNDSGGNDCGYSVQQTADSGYIIAGITRFFGAYFDDVYLIKTDSNGDTLWTKTYGGTDHDGGLSVQQTTDDGYIVCGYTCSFYTGLFPDCNVYLVKTDANGDTLWTKFYGGSQVMDPDDEWGYSVQQTTDNGYIITGYTQSFGAGSDDVWLLRIAGEPGIEETKDANLSTVCILFQNRPNPFKTETAIHYQLSQPNVVTIVIYNVSGQCIKTLVNESKAAGYYTVHWNGQSQDNQRVSNGIYFCRMKAGEYTSVKKILLMR